MQRSQSNQRRHFGPVRLSRLQCRLYDEMPAYPYDLEPAAIADINVVATISEGEPYLVPAS